MQLILTPDYSTTLTEHRATLLAKIYAAVAAARARSIATVSGQSETYIEKYNDAAAFIAAGYPVDASPYIWVQAEADVTTTTPSAAADSIVAARNAWRAVGVEIERRRLMGKYALLAASSLVDAVTATSTTIAALELL